MERARYSGHLSIMDVIFRSQFTLSPRTDLSVVDTRKHGCNHGDILKHTANHLFCKKKISTNHSNSILVHVVGQIFHALQTLSNQWLPNYNINMLSSNILSFGSFFSQHRPIDKSGLDTLAPESRIKCLKQNKLIWKEPLCSGHLSITDTIRCTEASLLQKYQ